MKICPSCHVGQKGAPPSCTECGAALAAEPEREGDDLAGMFVGDRYELVELLGEGTMGWVYRALHRDLERAVTVKLFKSIGITSDEQLAYFRREARAVSRLHHPHIVSVIDSGSTAGGMLYLVMEYVEGPTLYRMLYENPQLPLSRALSIFQQICAAVEEAHRLRVVHRDLKPENILITELTSGEEFAKVLDFGIAALGDDTGWGEKSGDGLVGTPGYVAPENIVGGPVTERTDVYSLGVILYELLTGREPFYEESLGKLLDHHLNDPPPRLSEIAPTRELGEAFERVVSRALAKDPAERYGTVLELRSELFKAAAELGSTRLACNRCRRPVDPLTGLCSLHRRAEPQRNKEIARTVPNLERPPSAARPTPDAEIVDRDWEALVARIVGDDLIGRKHAAERLVDFVLGEERLLEIVGPPGSGKSSLVAGLEAAAAELGTKVVVTRGDPRLVPTPWYPIRQLVGRLLGCGEAPDSRDRVRTDGLKAHVPDKLIPGLFELYNLTLPGDRREGVEQRLNSLRAAAFHVLTESPGGAAPRCFVFEDAQTFDRASASFIHGIASIGRGWPHKLVLTSPLPTGQERDDHPVIELDPLAESDVREMVARSELGASPRAETISRAVFEAGGGNPLHTRQALAAAGDEEATLAPLGDLLAYRMGSLPPEALRVFRAVSALGRKVSPKSLAGLVDEDQLHLALELLIKKRLLDSDGPRTVSPSHPLLGTAALDTMEPNERAALFGKLLERMEREGAPPLLLARLAEEAGSGERAVELLEEAGDQAIRWLDHETAALDHLQRAQLSARWQLLLDESDERYLKLLLARASALAFSGHRLSAEEVVREIVTSAAAYPHLVERAEQLLESPSP